VRSGTWGLGLWTKRYRSGEIFRKLDRSANCRCSRQQRPIAVASSQTGGGQQRLKRGHSPWSCQSSVGHGHAYTAAGPFSFSGSIHFIDHRFRIARYFLRLLFTLLINLSLELWTILWITSTIIPFAYRHFIWFWRFSDNSERFKNCRFYGIARLRYLKYQKCLQRSANFSREPSKKIWLGSWTPPVSTEDVFLRDRATTYFRFQCCWRSLSSTWQQEDWTPLVYTKVPSSNCVSRDRSYIHISLKAFDWLSIKIVQHGWTRSNWSVLRRWRKVRRRIEEVRRRPERYLKVATWLLPKVSIRLDSTKISKPPKLGGNILINRYYRRWKKWEEERKSHLPT